MTLTIGFANPISTERWEIRNFIIYLVDKYLQDLGLDYFSLVKPLKEKYAEQNLNDLAKHGKCDIKVWFQAKRSEEAKLIASSGTTYTDELNFVTKNKYHPYSHSR